MGTPFLLAETPRGGRFGHRFIIPPEPVLRSNLVEAYFRRAAMGRGNDFIAVSRQVHQHLHDVLREGAETLLLAGLNSKDLNEATARHLRQLLERLQPELEKLVTETIDWDEEGSRTMVVRDELRYWLLRDLAAPLDKLPSAGRRLGSGAITRSPRKERTSLFIGTLLGLVVGLLTLYLWFF